MDKHQLIRLGMFAADIGRIGKECGFYLQDADVMDINGGDPVAIIGAGGGNYCLELYEKETECIKMGLSKPEYDNCSPG